MVSDGIFCLSYFLRAHKPPLWANERTQRDRKLCTRIIRKLKAEKRKKAVACLGRSGNQNQRFGESFRRFVVIQSAPLNFLYSFGYYVCGEGFHSRLFFAIRFLSFAGFRFDVCILFKFGPIFSLSDTKFRYPASILS